MTRRPRHAPRVLHAARRHPEPGRLVELQPAHQPAPRLRVRGHPGQPRRRADADTTSIRASGSRIGSTRRPCCAPASASSTAPYPDNSYAFNFPVKQNNQFTAANAFVDAAGVSMATGFPAPVVADIPQNGIIDAGADPRLRNAAYFVRAHGPEGGPSLLVERRVPAGAAAGASSGRSPTSATMATTSVPALNLNAGLVARRRQRRPAAVRARSAARRT